MICTRCQKEVDPQSNFCPHCGNRIQTPGAREPGEIKAMILKVAQKTGKEGTKENVILLITLAMAITMALHWCLGELTDQEFLKIIEDPIKKLKDD